MAGYIISANQGGLGNRIKCLVSSMRIAERSSKSLILFWPENTNCNCAFPELFVNKIDEINREEFNALINHYGKEKYQVNNTWRFIGLPEDKLSNNFAKIFPSELGNDIDFEYERIPLLVRHNFLSYINKLSPQNYIIEEVSKFSENFDTNTISINIRSWEKEERNNFFNINSLSRIMGREKKKKLFIVCDSQKILNEISKRYGNRILYYPRRAPVGDRNSPEGIQDSLIELLLLSKNNELKVSLLSTYSEVAWWFGGCRAKVETIPSSFSGRIYLFRHRIETKIRRCLYRHE